MKKDLSVVISQDGKWFVAQCLEIDVASQGKTEKEAIDNLCDALLLHFMSPVATVLPNIRRIELEVAV